MPRVYTRDLPPDEDDIAISATVGKLLATGIEEMNPPFKAGDRVMVNSDLIHHFHNGFDKIIPLGEIGTRTIARMRYLRDLFFTEGYTENIGWVMKLDGIEKPNLFLCCHFKKAK